MKIPKFAEAQIKSQTLNGNYKILVHINSKALDFSTSCIRAHIRFLIFQTYPPQLTLYSLLSYYLLTSSFTISLLHSPVAARAQRSGKIALPLLFLLSSLPQMSSVTCQLKFIFFFLLCSLSFFVLHTFSPSARSGKGEDE